MKNPSNENGSDKASDQPTDKADKSDEAAKSSTDDAPKPKQDTYKLKKEAAVPGTMKVRDTGAGDGDTAKAGGGKVTPVESSLVGDAKGPAAAAPKDSAVAKGSAAPKDSAAVAMTSIPSVTKSEEKAPKADEKATKPADKKPESKAPLPPPPPVIQKTGFWRGVFGGVVGACLVLALLAWALPNLLVGWVQDKLVNVDVSAIKAEAVTAAQTAAQNLVDEKVSGLTTGDSGDGEIIATLQTKLEEQTERISKIEDGLTTLSEKAPEIVAAVPAAAGDLSSAVTQLRAQLKEQADQLATLSARPVLNPEAVARVEELASNSEALQQQISAAAEAAKTQLTAVQAEATKLQETAAETTRRAEAVAAAAALQAALDRGVSAEESKQVLENVGIEAPEALQRDVPSLETLQSNFADASRAALSTVRSNEAVESGNVLTNFLKAQTGARSVTPREGDDPDSILSRANAAVETGDIAAALEEMASLPDLAKSAPAMAEWLTSATAYRDAQKALSDLTAAKN